MCWLCWLSISESIYATLRCEINQILNCYVCDYLQSWSFHIFSPLQSWLQFCPIKAQPKVLEDLGAGEGGVVLLHVLYEIPTPYSVEKLTMLRKVFMCE